MGQLSRFSNKVIIITGAASGMGRATVIRMVAEGGTVIGVDLNESGLEETVQLALKTAGNGGSVSYMIGSVSDEKTVIKIVSDVVTNYGKLDVLVNNAGILRSSHTTETSVEEFQTIINTNLLSVFMFCREALPHLIKTQGNIVNLASTSAFFWASLYDSICSKQRRSCFYDSFISMGILEARSKSKCCSPWRNKYSYDQKSFWKNSRGCRYEPIYTFSTS